jgi:rRNA small subunit pseudouridine methyltransferase Nep1
MKKIRVVVADAQLDPIPPSLWKHPSVISDSKRRRRHPSKILLYIPIHYTAMKEYGIPMEKYGRPDITHRILLSVLDHPLTKLGYTEIYIYTRDKKIIWVNPTIRLPLDFYRFEGLIIQLLKKKSIPPEDGSLMRIIDNMNLGELIKKPIILTTQGEYINKFKIEKLLGRTVIVGAFQRGDYSDEITSLNGEYVSVYKETLLASTALNIFLTYIYLFARF